MSSRHVGRLIGRGGASIGELRQRSGARIEIGEEGDNETDIHLYGSDQQRKDAERLVNEHLGYSNAYHPPEDSGAAAKEAPIAWGPIDWGSIKRDSEKAQKEKWEK